MSYELRLTFEFFLCTFAVTLFGLLLFKAEVNNVFMFAALFFVFVFFPLTDVGAEKVYSQKENLVLIILEN